jgi:LuxR family maltose regulon positive regulatory protein
MGADARLALDLDDLDTPARCTADFLIALSSYLSGRADEGRSALEQVHQVSQERGSHQSSALALSELALLAADDEDWEAARGLSDRAMAVLQQHELDEIPFLAPAHCSAALVAGHFDGPVTAGLVVQQAATLFASAVEPPLWMGVQCREVLARAELSIGDTSAARTLLSEAQSLLTQTALDDAGEDPLRDRLERTWRRVAGRPLDLSPGSTLTRAELRVLRLLPTHLSFAQIGQQLFVSRNTVKTQAVSAYRKLGVGSRSDAVDRARALGLLQPPSA